MEALYIILLVIFIIVVIVGGMYAKRKYGEKQRLAEISRLVNAPPT